MEIGSVAAGAYAFPLTLTPAIRRLHESNTNANHHSVRKLCLKSKYSVSPGAGNATVLRRRLNRVPSRTCVPRRSFAPLQIALFLLLLNQLAAVHREMTTVGKTGVGGPFSKRWDFAGLDDLQKHFLMPFQST